MKKICFLLTIMALMVSCSSKTASDKGTTTGKTTTTVTPEVINAKLSPDVFKIKLAALPNTQLIDVRTPEEYAEGHLDKALNYDFYKEGFEAQLKQLNINQPVMVYCKSGGRSGKTATKLKEMGFREVYDMDGGYTKWIEDLFGN